MFVVCAQAPGRIDGVLVVLVVEVLITSHSACPLMRAAQGVLPNWHVAWRPRHLRDGAPAPQKKVLEESSGPLAEGCRDCLDIS